MHLQCYNIDIQYKKVYLADTFSRHFTGDELHLNRFEFEEALEASQIEDINQMIASRDKLSRLKNETDKDEVLLAVKAIIQSGWPESNSSLPANVTPYFHFFDEMVGQEGLILCGNRVAIPKALMKEIMMNLHTAQQGIESTLRRTQESIYWPKMNSEVKEYISKCEICLAYSPHPHKEPLLSREVSDRLWGKVAQTFFSLRTKTSKDI